MRQSPEKSSFRKKVEAQIATISSPKVADKVKTQINDFAKKIKQSKLPPQRVAKIWHEIRNFLRARLQSSNPKKFQELQKGLDLRLQVFEKGLNLKNKPGEVYIVKPGDSLSQIIKKHLGIAYGHKFWLAYGAINRSRKQKNLSEGSSYLFIGEAIDIKQTKKILKEMIANKESVLPIIQDYSKRPENAAYKINTKKILAHMARIETRKGITSKPQPPKSPPKAPKNNIDRQPKRPPTTPQPYSALKIQQHLNKLFLSIRGKSRAQKITALQQGLKHTNDLLHRSSASYADIFRRANTKAHINKIHKQGRELSLLAKTKKYLNNDAGKKIAAQAKLFLAYNGATKPMLSMTPQAKALALQYKQTCLEQLRNLEGPQVKVGQKLYDSRYDWYIGEITALDSKTGKATIKWYKPPLKLNGTPAQHFDNPNSTQQKNYPGKTKAERWQQFYNKKLHFRVAANGTSVLHPADISAQITTSHKKGKKTINTKSRPIQFVTTQTKIVTLKNGKKRKRINIVKRATSRYEQKAKAIKKEIQRFNEALKQKNAHYATYKRLYHYLQRVTLQLQAHRQNFNAWAQSVENKWMLTWTDMGKLIGHTAAGGTATEMMQARNLAEAEYEKRHRGLIKIEKKFKRFKHWSQLILNALSKGKPIPDTVMTQMETASKTDPFLYELLEQHKLHLQFGKNPPPKALAAMRAKVLQNFQNQKNHTAVLHRFHQSVQAYTGTSLNINGVKHSINRIDGKKSLSRQIHETIMNNLDNPKLRLNFSLHSSQDLLKIANNSEMMSILKKHNITISMVKKEINRLRRLEKAMKEQKPDYYKSFMAMSQTRAKSFAELNKSFFSKINWKNFKSTVSSLGKGALNLLDDPTTALMMATGAIALRAAGSIALRVAAQGTLKYTALQTLVGGMLMYPINSGTLLVLSQGQAGREILTLDPQKHGINLMHSMGMMVTGGLARHGGAALSRALRQRLLAQSATGTLTLAQRAAISSAGSTLSFSATMGSLVTLDAAKNYTLTGKAQWTKSLMHSLQFDLAMRSIHWLRAGVTSARMNKLQRKYTKLHERADQISQDQNKVTKQTQALANELAQLQKVANPTPQQQQRISQIQQQQTYLNQRTNYLQGEALTLSQQTCQLEISHTQHNITQTQQKFQKGQLTEGEYKAKMNTLQAELGQLKSNLKILQDSQSQQSQAPSQTPQTTPEPTTKTQAKTSADSSLNKPPRQTAKQWVATLHKRARTLLSNITLDSSADNRRQIAQLKTGFQKIWKTLSHPKAKAFLIKTFEAATLQGVRKSDRVKALTNLWNRRGEIGTANWAKIKPFFGQIWKLVRNETGGGVRLKTKKKAPSQTPKSKPNKLTSYQRSPVLNLLKKLKSSVGSTLKLDVGALTRSKLEGFKNHLVNLKNHERSQQYKTAIGNYIQLIQYLLGPRTNYRRANQLWRNKVWPSLKLLPKGLQNKILEYFKPKAKSETIGEKGGKQEINGKTKNGTQFSANSNEGIFKKDFSKRAPHNEDRIVINPKENLFAVIDGVGGSSNGQRAAQILAQQIQKYPNSPQRALNTAAKMMKAEKITGGGACVAICKIQTSPNGKQTLEVTYAGDVKVAVFNKNGKQAIDPQTGKPMETTDHSMVQGLVDHKIITPDQAFYHPKRHVVGSTVMASGQQSASNPNGFIVGKTTFTLKPGQRIAIMSDGISDNMGMARLGRTIANKPLQQAQNDAMGAATSRMQNSTQIKLNTVAEAHVGPQQWSQMNPQQRQALIHQLSSQPGFNLTNASRQAREKLGRYSDRYLAEPKADHVSLLVLDVGNPKTTKAKPTPQPQATTTTPKTQPTAKPTPQPKPGILTPAQKTRWAQAKSDAKAWKIKIPKRNASGQKLSKHDQLIILEQKLQEVRNQIRQLKIDAKESGANFDQLLAKTSRRFRQRPIGERLQKVAQELNGIISEKFAFHRAKLADVGLNSWFKTKRSTRPQQLRQIDDMIDSSNRLGHTKKLAQELGLDGKALKETFNEVKTQQNPTSAHQHIDLVNAKLQAKKTELQKDIIAAQAKLRIHQINDTIPANQKLYQQLQTLNQRLQVITVARQKAARYDQQLSQHSSKSVEYNSSQVQTLTASSLPSQFHLRVSLDNGLTYHFSGFNTGSRYSLASAGATPSQYTGTIQPNTTIGTSIKLGNHTLSGIKNIEVWTPKATPPAPGPSIQNPTRFRPRA